MHIQSDLQKGDQMKLHLLQARIIIALELTLAVLFFGPDASSAVALPATTTFRVDVAAGVDVSDCGSILSPCKSIQYAVNLAANGDIILVAMGSYFLDSIADPCTTPYGTTGVVCLVNKQISILGGYTASNWTTPSPVTNVTIIDGSNTYRGVMVIGLSGLNNLDMEGFTIQNGVAHGIPARSGDDQIFAFGAGMFVDFGSQQGNSNVMTLRNMIFKNNTSTGTNTATTYGGAGAGGGVALRYAPNVTMEYVTFDNNHANGGSGPDRGGVANGGAIHADHSTITGHDLTFTNNKATAGSSSGIGQSPTGIYADAVGGATAIQIQSSATWQNVTVISNTATGGNANTNNGTAGGAFGGGLFAEQATLSVTNGNIRQNLALAGNAALSWLAGGGGIESADSNLTLSRTYVISNTASTGIPTTSQLYSAGSPGGGGIYATRFSGSTTVNLTNCVVADNIAKFGGGGDFTRGGGGGGIWLQSTSATITHATVARNQIGSNLYYGSGMLLLGGGATGSTATISYSIISDHTNANVAALHNLDYGSNVVTLNRGLYAANSKNDNSDGLPAPPPASGFIGVGTMLTALSAGYVSSGSPNFNYHLRSDSAAKDQATGSSSMLVDIDNQPRPFPSNGVSDIGADEYELYSIYLPQVAK